MTRTWFITGASRGMGREMVEQLLDRGDTVAATLRTPGQLDELARRHGDRLWLRTLNVTDTAALRRIVDEAFDTHDRIDAVVSNAGYGVFGVAEDLDDHHVDDMIATNLTASIQLARAVVQGDRLDGLPGPGVGELQVGGVRLRVPRDGQALPLPSFGHAGHRRTDESLRARRSSGP